MTERVWQTTEYKVVTSSITRRRIIVNLSDDCFLIPESFDSGKARHLAAEFHGYCKGLSSSRAPSRHLRPFLSPFDSVTSDSTLGEAINVLTKHALPICVKGDKARIIDLLLALWFARCLVWPRRPSTIFGKFEFVPSEWALAHANPRMTAMLSDFRMHLRGTKYTQKHAYRDFFEIMVARGGVEEIGDLTPDIYDGASDYMKRDVARRIPVGIIAEMRLVYGPDRVSFSPADFGDFSIRAPRLDDRFLWVLTADPSLENWRAAAESWLGQVLRNRGGKRISLNAFLDYLVANPLLPREPMDYLRRKTWDDGSFRPFSSSRAVAVGCIADFLDSLLDARCVEEGDDGHPYLLPGFANPIIRIAYTSPRGQTYREAIPTKYVTLLKEILTENNHAWPREFGWNQLGRGGDYQRSYNATTGRYEDEWCPVRAFLVLLKLETPLRTFQARMLNSGEADTLRFNIQSGIWENNLHALTGEADPPAGVIRRQNHRLCLFINTNKTVDIARGAESRGYEIPWDHRPVIEMLSKLRCWQETFNPVNRLTPWIELVETVINKNYSAEELVARGAETFLFRDPISIHPDQPVTDNRANSFWLGLICELERRLKTLGIPEKLVMNGSRGYPEKSIYDLHSLRVTWITAMAEQGVDLAVLMKVAGHCTAIMTAYYTKHSIAYVTDVLSKASDERLQRQQNNWIEHLKSKEYRELDRITAFNDSSGLLATAEGTGASWVRLDFGVCPVGCNRCHDGGPFLKMSSGEPIYSAVAGPGRQNCVRCRFFITGPCFLIGLHAHFNAIGFRYREASRRYGEAKLRYERLDHARARASASHEAFLAAKEWETASTVLDQETRNTDEEALTWHATYNLIQQCLALLRNRDAVGDGDKFALVAVGDLSDIDFPIEVDERGEREFELFDNVCQSAVFFKSIDPDKANLKRLRMFDAFLKRSGYEAAFCEMTDDDALAIGNEMAKFMFTQFGRETTNALMKGDATLRSLGIDDERALIGTLESLTRQRILPRSRNVLIDAPAAETAAAP